MRKKIPEEDKRKTISVSIHPDLVELLEKYTKENDINKSKVVEKLLKKYLDKNND
jgi:metal-responsive CopG/Arc/MetJ family transcriptional regulator